MKNTMEWFKVVCKVCGVGLDKENWYPSQHKQNIRICKECSRNRSNAWNKGNPEKVRKNQERQRNTQGMRPFNENKECSLYLGVHVAERVLRHVFKDVEVMPTKNPGYDFICNKGKKIDVKSSCLRKDGRWGFSIHRNTTADYFLCIAFDNREDLNPLHVWLLPGERVNCLSGIGISPSTISRWHAYRLDITKINVCCDAIKNQPQEP